jgi:hypothetical protein
LALAQSVQSPSIMMPVESRTIVSPGYVPPVHVVQLTSPDVVLVLAKVDRLTVQGAAVVVVVELVVVELVVVVVVVVVVPAHPVWAVSQSVAPS